MPLKFSVGNTAKYECYSAAKSWLAGLIVLAICTTSLSILKAEPATAKIVGLGASTCTQFARDVKKNPAVQRDYLAWAQGFMSGILLGRPPGVDESLDLIPTTFPLHKQIAFLRAYCQKHPTEDFSDAVLDLYKNLRKAGMI